MVEHLSCIPSILLNSLVHLINKSEQHIVFTVDVDSLE